MRNAWGQGRLSIFGDEQEVWGSAIRPGTVRVSAPRTGRRYAPDGLDRRVNALAVVIIVAVLVMGAIAVHQAPSAQVDGWLQLASRLLGHEKSL